MTLVAVGALGLVASAARRSSEVTGPASGTISRLQLDGVVDPFIADYLEQGIADAADEGASAVLIEIDTPGGLVSSTRQITQVLNAQVPVLGYVAPSGARAASAGSFVLLSTDVAAMAPARTLAPRRRWGSTGPSGRTRP